MSSQPCFALLCKDDRRQQYQAILQGYTDRVHWAASLDQLLVECLKQPPLAILVDIPTQLALGSNNVAPIYDLKVKWPVIRCKIASDGEASVMCLAPVRSGTLLEAVEGILGGDEGWAAAGHKRYHLRINMQCRVRMRNQEGPWRHSHTLDLSTRGAFILNYEDLQLEHPLDLELHDLGESVLRIKATVRWVRRWQESQKLSGVGVSFEPCDDLQKISDAIVQQRGASILQDIAD